MTREKIRAFWTERAKVTSLPRSESQVNFENDSEIADLRIKTETELIDAELPLKAGDTVVDLGAGNGRFSLLFAPKVHKVIAVEFIDDFARSIEKQASERHIRNIKVLNMPAEDFCIDDSADIVFVSGLLHYLDPDQYNRTVSNISKILKRGCTLFLRETISVLEDEFFIDKFSEELGANYCSLYRTKDQIVRSFSEQGFHLEKICPFFPDGSVLNKRVETRLYYFTFRNVGTH